jgi:4-oxalocrotonate tautomerase
MWGGGSNPTLRTNKPFRKINWSGISLDNKKKMVEGITKVLEDIGIPSQATTIIISEEPKENWASAGKLHSETFQK